MDQRRIENASRQFRAPGLETGPHALRDNGRPRQPQAAPDRGRSGETDRRVRPPTPWWAEFIEESLVLKKAVPRPGRDRDKSPVDPARILRREALLSARTPWPPTPECAGAETLRNFLAGGLGPEERAGLEAHMGKPCRHCLRSLADLYRGAGDGR
jgi:hypothetical protein